MFGDKYIIIDTPLVNATIDVISDSDGLLSAILYMNSTPRLLLQRDGESRWWVNGCTSTGGELTGRSRKYYTQPTGALRWLEKNAHALYSETLSLENRRRGYD